MGILNLAPFSGHQTPDRTDTIPRTAQKFKRFWSFNKISIVIKLIYLKNKISKYYNRESPVSTLFARVLFFFSKLTRRWRQKARFEQLKRAELFILHFDSAEISFVFRLASSWSRHQKKLQKHFKSTGYCKFYVSSGSMVSRYFLCNSLLILSLIILVTIRIVLCSPLNSWK